MSKTISEFLSFTASHPHTGTADEISTLSMGIAEAAVSFDAATLRFSREELEKQGIGEKVFSKLRVVGKTLLKINEADRAAVIKQFPASYSTIHLLCSLKPEELVRAAKSRAFDPSVSVRAARTYVQQVRFPARIAQVGEDQEKGRWSIKQEQVLGVFRPDHVALGEEDLLLLQTELRRVCSEFGLEVRQVNSTSATTLRKQMRVELEVFWRRLLEKNLSAKWFKDRSPEIRKEFDLRTVEELINTPLRTFTGFLQRSDGGKAEFWERHGQRYISKVHLEMAKTDDHAQRYNLKRRVEKVLGERKDLAIWTNLMLREGGFVC